MEGESRVDQIKRIWLKCVAEAEAFDEENHEKPWLFKLGGGKSGKSGVDMCQELPASVCCTIVQKVLDFLPPTPSKEDEDVVITAYVEELVFRLKALLPTYTDEATCKEILCRVETLPKQHTESVKKFFAYVRFFERALEVK
jgi:hypothetical protein